MSRLDNNLLHHFRSVYRHGSMTSAARALGISTSAVSQAIDRLERDLDLKLFVRAAHGLNPTPAANYLFDKATTILNDIELAFEESQLYRQHMIPSLKVYVIESASTYLTPALVPMLDTYVGELILVSGWRGTNALSLLRGDIDIAISTECFQDVEGMDRFLICSERLVLLTSARIEPEDRDINLLSERYPLLRISRGRRTDGIVSHFLMRHGIHPKRVVECASASAIIELVARGYGWTITTPMSACHLKPDPARVAWTSIADPSNLRHLYLICRGRQYLDLPQALANVCRKTMIDEAARWRATIAPEAFEAFSAYGLSKKDALVPHQLDSARKRMVEGSKT